MHTIIVTKSTEIITCTSQQLYGIFIRAQQRFTECESTQSVSTDFLVLLMETVRRSMMDCRSLLTLIVAYGCLNWFN